MRAVVCPELGPGTGDKLVLENDWPAPEVGEQDVLIRVKAAGLNFPDVLLIQGLYQFQPELPFIPGGELSGVVEAVGDKVTRFKPGDEVVSMGQVGGFCELAAANEMVVFPKPAALSFEEAAGIAITYFTSYYALNQRAQLKEGETLLVLGAAGGVGTSAIELGKLRREAGNLQGTGRGRVDQLLDHVPQGCHQGADRRPRRGRGLRPGRW